MGLLFFLFVFFLGLAPVKRDLNSSCQLMLDDSTRPTLYEQFGEGPFCSSTTAPVHKARSIKAWLDRT